MRYLAAAGMLAIAAVAAGQEGMISGADLAKKYPLKEGDANMREGRYLEAAVAYRNALLEPGDREAVRIPFAVALLAAGETSYAGIEIRRAQLFCADFSRVRIDVVDLFGSRDALIKLVEEAEKKKVDGDGGDAFAAFAYARLQLGQAKEAREWIARLDSARGEDSFSKALRELHRDEPSPAAGAPPVPKSLEKLQARVDQMPGTPKKPPEPGVLGTPSRSPIAFIEYGMVPKGEIFEK